MTNEQVIKRINEIREILADYRELTSYDHEALDIAISALSKQSASCKQVEDVPDIHVGKTDLLEKLTRYEPEENATADKILIDLAEAIEIVNFECGEWQGLAQTIVNGLKKLSPKQSEKIPYKKPEIVDIAKVTMAMAKGADMVQVTRCKDCKYSVDAYNEGDCYCYRPQKALEYVGDWNFFCGAADRKEK